MVLLGDGCDEEFPKKKGYHIRSRLVHPPSPVGSTNEPCGVVGDLAEAISHPVDQRGRPLRGLGFLLLSCTQYCLLLHQCLPWCFGGYGLMAIGRHRVFGGLVCPSGWTDVDLSSSQEARVYCDPVHMEQLLHQERVARYGWSTQNRQLHPKYDFAHKTLFCAELTMGLDNGVLRRQA